MNNTKVTCPECSCEFEPDASKGKSLDVEGAAEGLLTNYLGFHPSVGDVQKLKERITKVLVSDFGISEGKI